MYQQIGNMHKFTKICSKTILYIYRNVMKLKYSLLDNKSDKKINADATKS